MYIVKKPLTIGSERRPVGAVVTAEEAPNAALLERAGYLVKAQEPFSRACNPGGFIIPLADKDGSEEISVGEEEVLTAFRILQNGAEDAVNALGDIVSAEASPSEPACRQDSRRRRRSLRP